MWAVPRSTPPGQGGLASSLRNTSRQADGVLGLAILASVGAGHTRTQHGASHAALAAGFSAAFGVGVGIFAATAMIGSLILPRQASTPIAAEGAQGNGEGEQPAPGGTDGRGPARNYAGGR
jgi:hypothetical protein